MADEMVMDAPELDAGTEVETELETPAEGTEPTEVAEGKPESDSPYTTKYSREMRAALKALETQHPESAKYLKQARDNHARLFALTQLEEKGIDGVRENYDALKTLVINDPQGKELHGIEAARHMQEQLAGIEEVDNLLIAGDPKAFDALGEDFNAGLAKLAPAYLDRIKTHDPAAYEAAVLPHFVGILASSDLVKEYNALVDVLNAQNDPRFDAKTKADFTMTQLAKMGQWLNAQQAKAGEIKPVARGTDGADDLTAQRTELDQERQKLHWDTKIKPLAVAHENKTFETLFAPYGSRLKLDAPAKADLMEAFKAGIQRAGTADQEYLRQMKIYRGQKNPDPVAVANFVKNAINKHSKPVMEALIRARYSPFLNGKPKTAAPTNGAGKPRGPVEPNVEIRTVKPPMNEIDHQRTPIEWLAKKQYRLFNGKVIQIRPVQ